MWYQGRHLNTDELMALTEWYSTIQETTSETWQCFHWQRLLLRAVDLLNKTNYVGEVCWAQKNRHSLEQCETPEKKITSVKETVTNPLSLFLFLDIVSSSCSHVNWICLVYRQWSEKRENIRKASPGLMSPDFSCVIHIVEFGIKHMKSWIHPAWFQQFRLLMGYNDAKLIFLP